MFYPFRMRAGFSPDVKVWEVKFKGGKYAKTVSAFNLSGHTSGIFDLDFDRDTSNMATVSKDGTWKVFATNSKLGGETLDRVRKKTHAYFWFSRSLLIERHQSEARRKKTTQ